MKTGIKGSLTRSLSSKYTLNHKAMQIRNSWDEVESMLKTVNKTKRK